MDAWTEKYLPIQNHLVTEASWDGNMFETYGNEYDYVAAQPQQNVWTWVDGDDGTYIVAGWHYVNRIGYFVTEKAWTDGDLVIAYEKYEEGV